MAIKEKFESIKSGCLMAIECLIGVLSVDMKSEFVLVEIFVAENVNFIDFIRRKFSRFLWKMSSPGKTFSYGEISVGFELVEFRWKFLSCWLITQPEFLATFPNFPQRNFHRFLWQPQISSVSIEISSNLCSKLFEYSMKSPKPSIKPPKLPPEKISSPRFSLRKTFSPLFTCSINYVISPFSRHPQASFVGGKVKPNKA
jgi:hypothetical protein